MEENTTFFGALLERIESFSKTTIDLMKLKAVDKLSKVSTVVVFGLLLALFVFFFLMIFNIALALWLGKLFGEIYLGFFVVAGFYVLLIIILVLFKKQLIKTPLTNTIISKFLK
jgi:hypothetical protein